MQNCRQCRSLQQQQQGPMTTTKIARQYVTLWQKCCQRTDLPSSAVLPLAAVDIRQPMINILAYFFSFAKYIGLHQKDVDVATNSLNYWLMSSVISQSSASCDAVSWNLSSVQILLNIIYLSLSLTFLVIFYHGFHSNKPICFIGCVQFIRMRRELY